MTFAAAALVFWGAFAPWLQAAGFARRGDYTYGIYLYAFPIQQPLVRYFGPHQGPASLFAVAWAASVAAGSASWFAVERPFLLAGHSRRPAVADATPA